MKVITLAYLDDVVERLDLWDEIAHADEVAGADSRRTAALVGLEVKS